MDSFIFDSITETIGSSGILELEIQIKNLN